MNQKSALDQFLSILTQPDNIPIVGLMVLIFFFTYLALREARKNDQLIAQAGGLPTTQPYTVPTPTPTP